MRFPIKNQRNAVDFKDEAPTIDTSHLPSLTRQEFKLEADINTIVRRFGLTGQIALRQPVWGDRDFDLDLHTGFLALEEAQRGFLRLPQGLRDKYRNPKGLLDAIHNRTFKSDLEAEIAKREAPPPAPPIVPPQP